MQQKAQLYYVVEKNPKHNMWGIYARKKRSGRGNLFRLQSTFTDYELAVKNAVELQVQHSDMEFNVQGVASYTMPDRFDA